MNELMTKMTMTLGFVAALAATGCGDEAADQVIAGRIATATFAEPVTQVRAIGADRTIEAAVAADGTFALALPAGDRYRFELVSASRRTDLVIPRRGGGIGTAVLVAAADAPFALGDIRYLRDPASQTYDFGDACEEAPGGPVCAGKPGESGDGDGGGTGDGDGGGGDGDGDGDGGGTGDGDGGGGGDGDGGGGGDGDGGGAGDGDGGGTGDGGGGGDQDTGGACGGVDDANGSVGEDGAIADHTLPEAFGCDTGTGGGQDTGGGGQDTGGGGGGDA